MSDPINDPRPGMFRIEACTDNEKIGEGLIHTTYTSWTQNPRAHNDLKAIR